MGGCGVIDVVFLGWALIELGLNCLDDALKANTPCPIQSIVKNTI
jgi:hypothetical protein